mgnify:CR=1 FL=1
MNGKLLAILLWFPISAVAQGFAGLGTSSDGFSVPTPNATLAFPKDHGAHPEYRIEWWYITANLRDAGGADYGLQWTLFRTALSTEDGEGWPTPQLWMGHAAVTTPEAHFVTERLARGGIGQAGVTAEPFAAWIDEWEMSGDFDAPKLTANGPDFGYDMQLSAQGPIVLQGDNGYSVKSANGQASYYYSQPFYDIAGTLTLPSGDIPVTGAAWLDREWSSQPLSERQSGWDWFSLSFESGAKMMGFQLRQTDEADFSAATWIAPDGTATAFPDGAFAATPLETAQVAGREVRTTWQVRLPERGVDVTVKALNPSAWMDLSIPYWEGPVTIEGSHKGRGYLEMTGYE